MPKLGGMTIGVRPFFCVLAAASVTVAGPGGAAWAKARPHAHSAQPVVVELYTAQGCATCPKANGVVGVLAAMKGVLPLTFSVDYWDYLGWEDTLAKPEFTVRQRAYIGRLKVREIYTPEIVVDGAAESAALEQKKIDDLIAEQMKTAHRSPRVRFFRQGARVSVNGEGADVRDDVWMIRYDPAPQSVKVKAGENRGQSVTVSNAVRELKRLGAWKEGFKTYALPPAEDNGLKTVVVVQAPKGGRILAAAQL